MSARTVSILVLGGTLVAGLAACTSTATAPKATSFPTASATTPPLDKPVEAPASTPPTAKSPAAEAQPAGCPVTTKTLLAVLKGKYPDLATGHELTELACYRDYAIADSQAPGHDGEIAVFRYASGSWQYFTGGSAQYCEGVPADVKKHFRGVGHLGCR
jgi:hypothetical protein